MTETTVQLGDQVTDQITGFKGTAIAVTQWMHGCRRITVQPKGIDKEGAIFATEQFDEPQLTINKRANTPAAVKKKRAESGGPRPAVSKAHE